MFQNSCFRKETNVVSLKSRYTNLYIPSDFFNASFEWTEAFPCYRPFQIGNHCGFHVMHKDVEPLTANDSVLDPPDADHLFSAKVNRFIFKKINIESIFHIHLCYFILSFVSLCRISAVWYMESKDCTLWKNLCRYEQKIEQINKFFLPNDKRTPRFGSENLSSPHII